MDHIREFLRPLIGGKRAAIAANVRKAGHRVICSSCGRIGHLRFESKVKDRQGRGRIRLTPCPICGTTALKLRRR